MKWLLVLLAVNINDAQDIPGRVYVQFDTQYECETAKSTVRSWLKFDTFKVTAQCQKSS